MSGPALVKGDVVSSGTVTGGTVTGSITQNAPPFAPYSVLSCPAGGYTPAALVPLTTGVTYNATTGVLKISGGNTLTLAVPPTTYYFSQVVTSGGSQIIFNNPSNLHVDIWIDDLLNVSGGGFVNTSGKSTQLGLWSCGSSSSSTWTLSGGSGAYFSVYAPNHAVSVTGSGDIWGSIIGKTVTATGGSKFHYDEALGRGPPSGLNPIAGSWAQLPGT
jgi:hypothetical protein